MIIAIQHYADGTMAVYSDASVVSHLKPGEIFTAPNEPGTTISMIDERHNLAVLVCAHL